MKGLIPFGALVISGPGAITQALSTALAQMTAWASAGGANGPASTYDDGNPDVKPDYANSRVLVQAPGVYEVTVNLSGITDGTQDITLAIAKNGTALTTAQNKRSWTVSVKNQHVLTALVAITAADNPGTITTKPDPATTGFAGAGGFPKMMVPLTVQLASGASTPTLTFENCQFLVKRVG